MTTKKVDSTLEKIKAKKTKTKAKIIDVEPLDAKSSTALEYICQVGKVSLTNFLPDLALLYQKYPLNDWLNIKTVQPFALKLLNSLSDMKMDMYFNVVDSNGAKIVIDDNSTIAMISPVKKGILTVNESIESAFVNFYQHYSSNPAFDKTFSGSLIRPIKISYKPGAEPDKTKQAVITDYTIKPFSYGLVKLIQNTTEVEGLKDILAQLITFDTDHIEDTKFDASLICSRMHFIDVISFVWLIRGLLPVFLENSYILANTTLSYQE